MMNPDGNSEYRDTRLSILERLKSSGDRANFELGWSQFYTKYCASMHRWCISTGASSANAEDIVHDVMLRLVGRLREFEYDRTQSFKAWLKRACSNAAIDYLRKHGREKIADGQTIDQLIQAADLETTLDSMMRTELIDAARSRVRNELEAAEKLRDWEIYEAACDDQADGNQIADHFGVSRGHVYVIKNRILSKIQTALIDIEKGN